MAKTKKTVRLRGARGQAKRAKKKAVKKAVKKTVKRAPARKTKKRTTKKAPARKTAKIAKKKTAKKVVRRPSVKKGAKKSASSPARSTRAGKNSSRELVVAVGDECFWIYEGSIVKDLNELASAFKEMQEYQFAHHIQKSNDFANWVEAVLRDKQCANALRRANTISESLFVLDHVLRRYT